METIPQCSMAGKVWFQYGNTRSKISLDGLEDVDDVRRAIRQEMTPKLDEYAAADLIITAALIEDKEGSQAVKLDAEDTLESILETLRVVNKPFATSIRFFVDVPPKASAGKLDSGLVFFIYLLTVLSLKPLPHS